GGGLFLYVGEAGQAVQAGAGIKCGAFCQTGAVCGGGRGCERGRAWITSGGEDGAGGRGAPPERAFQDRVVNRLLCTRHPTPKGAAKRGGLRLASKFGWDGIKLLVSPRVPGRLRQRLGFLFREPGWRLCLGGF